MICNYCKENETTMHVLLHCPHVHLFWQKLNYFIGAKFKKDIKTDEKMLLLGYDIDNNDSILVNVILVYAQFTIYNLYVSCQFTSKQFSFFSLLADFKRELIINLKFLEKNNKIHVTEEVYNEIKKL